MTKRQTKLSLFSIIMFGLMFVGMLAFVSVDALAQHAEDGDGSNEGIFEAPGPLNFYPVTPCRLSDSRVGWAQGVYRGPFFVGQTICFDNYGGGTTVGPQGGNLAGCNSPVGEPRAFHVNIAAVPIAGSGHVRLFPANVAIPRAAVLNWRWAVGNISNAVSADSFFDVGGAASTEFCIYIGGIPGGWTHIVMDVMGYFDF